MISYNDLFPAYNIKTTSINNHVSKTSIVSSII